MANRGQVTVFIVIAVFLVLIVVINYPALRDRAESGFTYSVEGVAPYVEQCLEQATREAVLVAGAQGGMPYPGSQAIPLGSYRVPILQFLGTPYTPDKEKLAQLQFKPYIQSALKDCVDFSLFPFPITAGDADASVLLLDDEVRVNLHYPVTVHAQNAEREFSEFQTTVNAPLGKMMDAMDLILKDAAFERRTVDLVQLAQMPYAVRVTTIPEDKYYVFTLTDNTAIVDGHPYVLQFASSYATEADYE